MYNINQNIFLLILLFLPIISYDHWTQVTDETFNWETTYDNVKWLLFFTHSNCKKCIPVYDLLNKTMKKYFNKRIGFVYIDTMKCPWISNRFNVSYVPKVILLEEDLMYIFHSNYNEENIMNFIDKKKHVETALIKPKGAKIKIIYKNFGRILLNKINISMQYILDKLHLPLKWNKYFTFFFVIIFLIIFIFFFVFILILFCKLITGICCCRFCTRTKKEENKNRLINNENIKEIIKEKIE